MNEKEYILVTNKTALMIIQSAFKQILPEGFTKAELEEVEQRVSVLLSKTFKAMPNIESSYHDKK